MLVIKKRNNLTSDQLNYIEKYFIKGLIRILVLSALREGGKCGYHIYRYVNNKTKLKTSLSTVYTIIRELVDRGLITRIGDIYQLTERGFETLNLFLKKYPKLKSIL